MSATVATVTRFFILEMVTYSYPEATPLPRMPYSDDLQLFTSMDEARSEVTRLERHDAEHCEKYSQTMAYTVTRHIATVDLPQVES